MQTTAQLDWLKARVMNTLSVGEEEAIELGLRLVLERIESNSKMEGDITFEQIIAVANQMLEESRGFTLDELMDDLYGDSPIFNPHKIKIKIGKMLSTCGFRRKQIRRSKTDRPLWWYKLSPDNKE